METTKKQTFTFKATFGKGDQKMDFTFSVTAETEEEAKEILANNLTEVIKYLD